MGSEGQMPRATQHLADMVPPAWHIKNQKKNVFFREKEAKIKANTKTMFFKVGKVKNQQHLASVMHSS